MADNGEWTQFFNSCIQQPESCVENFEVAVVDEGPLPLRELKAYAAMSKTKVDSLFRAVQQVSQQELNLIIIVFW